jgi:hypothetical protein
MRDLTFSIFPNAWGRKPKIKTQSWESWIKDLSVHEIIPSNDDETSLNAAKKQARALFLGTMDRSRSKKNVKSIDALSLDIDDKKEKEVNKSLESLDKFEWFAYSTHKHGSKCANDHPRIRVILPLSEPLDPADFFDAWDGLNELTSQLSDQSIRDVARLNFYPSTFSEQIQTLTHHNQGEWISGDYLRSLVPAPSVEDIYRADTILDLQRSLNSVQKDHPIKPLAQALIAGEALGEPGTRHSAILSLTMHLARKRPLTTQETLEALFMPSMEASGISDRLGEVWTAFEGALDKVKEEHGQHSEIYSLEELETIAKKQKCSIEDLEHRWVIQRGGGGWILSHDGEYLGPFPYRDFGAAIRMHLKKAPIDLVIIMRTGVRKKEISDIVEDNGAIALHVQADLTAETSTYDPDSYTFFEAVMPIRKCLQPRYDEEIAHWLELFSDGNGKILDYLSVVPDLNVPLCALYFDGAKGSGKTLLVQGIARIWSTGGAVKLSQVFSNFNSALSQCPIIFADEYVPKSSKNDPITEKLRELIGSSTRELTRKNIPDATLNGQVRLMMAANNEFLLQDVHLASKEDRLAVAQRFLYHKVPKKAADYLETLPKDQKREWLDKGIAEHVLWLQENHVIQNPGKRFVVDGDESEIHRMLLTGGYWNRIVCEWLVRYLDNPVHYDQLGLQHCRIHQGELLCNPQAITDHLSVYLKHSRATPETPKIGEALMSLSTSRDRVQLRANNKRVRYVKVDVEPLFDWAERYGVGTREEMIRTLNEEERDLDEMVREEWEGRKDDLYDA